MLQNNVNILAISLSVLHNHYIYIYSLIKLFSGLYLARFLDTSAKMFFPCRKISKKYLIQQYWYRDLFAESRFYVREMRLDGILIYGLLLLY